MSHGKQFTLFTSPVAPNPWKVTIVLEELGLSYESVYFSKDKGDLKAPEYTKYNPNGRIPAIIDHENGDFVIWESCAIIAYLAERYDKEHRVSASDEKGKITQLQWLFFQASGQGPYYGQAMWFMNSHSEKLPSAVERYQKETLRVLGVLDSVLSKQEWLVGDKATVADLSFIMWNNIAMAMILKGYNDNVETEFPAFFAWHQKLLARDAVKRTLEMRASLSRR